MANHKQDLEALGFRASMANVNNDDHFLELIRESKRVFGFSNEELADNLMVGRPTIDRWLAGVSQPHPATRKAIYHWIVAESTVRLMVRR